MEDNKLIVNNKNSIKTRDTGLSINRNDKSLLSFGASKFGLEIYEQKGWLDYDEVDDFHEGFARVFYNGKYNYINKYGKLLSKLWFNCATDFINGYATICVENEYNHLNKGGEILWKERFNYMPNAFHDGYSLVRKLDGFNYYDNNGNALFLNWMNYKILGNFSEGYAYVEIAEGKYNLINKKGNLLFQKDIIYKTDYEKAMLNGLIKVYDEEENYNFKKEDGSFLCKEWFGAIFNNFSEGYILVAIRGKGRNFMNNRGTFLLEDWLELAAPFSNGYALIRDEKSSNNFIDEKGKLLFREGIYCDILNSFNGGYAKIIDKLSEGVNFFDKRGKRLFLKNIDYDSVSDFSEGYVKVELNGKRNFIDKKGNLLF